jgi:hypothetical protein
MEGCRDGESVYFDAGGRFEITAVNAVRWVAPVASKDGYVKFRSEELFRNGRQSLDLVIWAKDRGTVLSGVVYGSTANGPVPLPNVTVTVCDDVFCTGGDWTQVTSADGRFRFDYGGWWEPQKVFALAPGWAFYSADVQVAGFTEHTITLKPSAGSGQIRQ